MGSHEVWAAQSAAGWAAQAGKGLEAAEAMGSVAQAAVGWAAQAGREAEAAVPCPAAMVYL